MVYNWIDIESLPLFNGNDTLILFGAGNGTEELLRYLSFLPNPPLVDVIIDNDPTLWDKNLKSIPIQSPETIPERLLFSKSAKIIVTTVSGREEVGRQLEAIGLLRDTDFFTVGCFPDQSMENFRTLLEMNDRFNFLNQQSKILHVGPGGFLGLDCALAACGHTVRSIDAYDFSMNYPIGEKEFERYRNTRNVFLSLTEGVFPDSSFLLEGWNSLFDKKGKYFYIDPVRAAYKCPFRFSRLPFEDQSMDLVISFAVLEHVRHPQKVVSEIRRVLTPGGISLHKIITRDHRSFGGTGGYSPVSYMQHSEKEWEEINQNKFHQNRVIPALWEALFSMASFEIMTNDILQHYPISGDEYEQFDETFKRLPIDRLEECTCLLAAKKVGN